MHLSAAAKKNRQLSFKLNLKDLTLSPRIVRCCVGLSKESPVLTSPPEKKALDQ